MYDIRPNQDYSTPQSNRAVPSDPPASVPPESSPIYSPGPESKPPEIPRGNIIGQVSGVIIILTIILVGGLFGYNYLKQSKISSSQQKLDEINRELESLKDTDQKAQALQKQVGNLTLAMSQRNYYSQFFTKLTPLIPKDTVFTTMAFAEGEIQASGQAASFDSIARMLASIRNSKEVENISLTSATSGETTKAGFPVSFSLSIKINQAALENETKKEVNISGGESGNQGSTNALNGGR